MGVKDAFAAMGELLVTSGAGWARAMHRQAWAGVLIIVAIGAAAGFLQSHHTPQGLNVLRPVADSILAFVFFADAMRALDPRYRIDGRRFLRLAGIAISTHVITLFAAMVPGVIAVFLFHHNLVLAFLVIVPVIIFFDARFCFVWFVSERADDPVASSWSLTAGVTLFATIVPAAIAWVPTIAVFLISAHITQRYGWFTPTEQVAAAATLAAFLRNAWIYPLTARWLETCTRVNRA